MMRETGGRRRWGSEKREITKRGKDIENESENKKYAKAELQGESKGDGVGVSSISQTWKESLS